jgi:hypothetical protein
VLRALIDFKRSSLCQNAPTIGLCSIRKVGSLASRSPCLYIVPKGKQSDQWHFDNIDPKCRYLRLAASIGKL